MLLDLGLSLPLQAEQGGGSCPYLVGGVKSWWYSNLYLWNMLKFLEGVVLVEGIVFVAYTLPNESELVLAYTCSGEFVDHTIAHVVYTEE